MLSLLVTLVIGLLIIGLVYWLVTYIPLPPPIKQGAIVVIVVIAVLWLIYVLLGIAGGVPLSLR